MTASLRQRLLNHNREHGENYGSVLTRYALERFLYRLSMSDQVDKFILKGAFRFLAWTDQIHRPIKDLDLLAFGDYSEDRLCKVIAKDHRACAGQAMMSKEARRSMEWIIKHGMMVIMGCTYQWSSGW